jgi:hypothetical protein
MAYRSPELVFGEVAARSRRMKNIGICMKKGERNWNCNHPWK